MTLFPDPTDNPAKLRLAAVPEAASVARSFVRSVLREHPRLDDAVLSVSELVTNVVRHAPAEEGIEVLIARQEAAFRVSVHQKTGSFRIDRSPREGVGGLGLMIVEKVSDAWGVDNQTGVWFEIRD